MGNVDLKDVNDVNEQDLELAQEAQKEREAEKAKKKEPWELAFESDYPDAEKEPSELKEKPKEEPKKEDKQTTEVKTEPEKPVETKVEPVENKVVVPDDDKEVVDFALKVGLTVEDAREELSKIKSITEKYKNDPKELARALRSTQSGYDKLRTERDLIRQEAETLKNRPVAPISPEVEVRSHLEQNRDKIIEAYRTKFPAKSRDLEDDAIMEDVFDRTLNGYNSWKQQQQGLVQQQATKKREDLLNSISDADKYLLPDVKVVLEKTADTHLLSNNFNLTDIIYWAKGQRYDKALKDAEERGYKRAMEQPRIIAQVPTATTSKSSPTKAPATPGEYLSNYDKQRALEMFDGTSLTEEEKYKEYYDLHKKKK